MRISILLAIAKHISTFFLAILLFIGFCPEAISLEQSTRANDPSRYIQENPKLALTLAKGALSAAKQEGDSIAMLQAHLTIAQAFISIGMLDSARINSNRVQLSSITQSQPDLWLSALKVKAILLQHEEKPREVRETLMEGLKYARKRGWKETETRLLLYIGDYYRQISRAEESLSYKKQALNLGLSLGDTSLIATCLHSMASSYWQQSAFDQAVEFYRQAIETRAKTKDTLGLIASHIGLALTYRDMSRYTEAHQELQEAIRLARIVREEPTIASILNLMGSLALRARDSELALDYYSQSYRMRSNLGLLSSAAATLENIARAQREIGLFNESLGSLDSAIILFNELGYTKQLASAYNEKGNLFSQSGNLAEALKFYLLSLKLRQEIGVEQDIARSLTNIGLTYRTIGSLNNALRYFEQALEFTHEQTEPIAASYAYIHLGNSYIDLGAPEQALWHYQKALELRNRTGNKTLIAQAKRSVATAYSNLDQTQRATNQLQQALDIYYELSDERGMATIFNELGNVAQQDGELSLALEYFEKGANLFLKLNDKDRLGLCYRKMGEILTQQGLYPKAEEYLGMALELGKESQNAKLVELTLLAFHTFYFQQERYREAYRFYVEHISIRDSLMSLKQEELVWQASLDLELNKKIDEIRQIEGEVEELRLDSRLKGLELDRQRTIRNFLSIIFSLVVIFAIGSIYGFFTIRKNNRLLAEKLRIINETNEKLEKSERNLKRTVQTKDKLFSIIAHDLRSPFTALTGITEVLASKANEMDTNEVKEYSELVHESSNKLLNLIEVLLEWSRSQTGKIKLIPKPLSIPELTSQTIDYLKLQADAKGLKLIDNTQPESTALADRDTTLTVLRNLISNAIKFTPKGGSITIGSQTEGNTTLITVADTGVGIAEDVLPKLFSLEDNVSTKGTSQETGTGLGLIVCKDFVEKNGGSISVESTPGVGSTFTVRLRGS